MKKNIFFALSCMLPLYAAQKAYLPHTTHTAVIPKSSKLMAEVSAGELLDKLTILQIKSERINDAQKLDHIQTELRAIADTIRTSITDSPELDYLIAELKSINEKLWDIEDAIRAKEARQEFDEEFITLARAVYFTNDQRGDIKRQINYLLGSHLMEEKQYTHYEQN